MGVMLLICSFALCAWTKHPADISGRHDVDFSLVLTAVAFKLVLTSMLPPVSYVTVLDIYVMTGFVFLTIVTIAHTAVPYFYLEATAFSPITALPTFVEGETRLIEVDKDIFWICSIGWLAFNVSYGLYYILKDRSNYRTFLAQSLKERT